MDRGQRDLRVYLNEGARTPAVSGFVRWTRDPETGEIEGEYVYLSPPPYVPSRAEILRERFWTLFFDFWPVAFGVFVLLSFVLDLL